MSYKYAVRLDRKVNRWRIYTTAGSPSEVTFALHDWREAVGAAIAAARWFNELGKSSDEERYIIRKPKAE